MSVHLQYGGGNKSENRSFANVKRNGDYLSGQEICERLNVSRTAVWKVIKQLEAEGYEIEAVRNRGYRLRFLGDVLSQAELESSIDSEWAGKNILYFDETDSTNIEIKKAAEKDAPHGTLAVADYQSMGKGRRGRSWAAPHGVGIWMSLLLRPELPPTCASMLTLVAALAVADRDSGRFVIWRQRSSGRTISSSMERRSAVS